MAELDKAIAKAFQYSYNMCFVITGGRGSGKDYCLLGGTVHSRLDQIMSQQTPGIVLSSNSPLGARISPEFAELEHQLASKQREPGLLRLAYETIIAQICINTNAQFSVQLTAGLI